MSTYVYYAQMSDQPKLGTLTLYDFVMPVCYDTLVNEIFRKTGSITDDVSACADMAQESITKHKLSALTIDYDICLR